VPQAVGAVLCIGEPAEIRRQPQRQRTLGLVPFVRKGAARLLRALRLVAVLGAAAASWTSVALGAIDGPTGLALERHIFVADKGDYYEIGDGPAAEGTLSACSSTASSAPIVGANDFEIDLAFEQPLMNALEIRASGCEPERSNGGFRAINLRFRPAVQGRNAKLCIGVAFRPT